MVNSNFESGSPSEKVLDDQQLPDLDQDTEDINANARTLGDWKELFAEQQRVTIAKKAEGVSNEDQVSEVKKRKSQFWEDQVQTIDKLFLTKKHRSGEDDTNNLMDHIGKDFTFNEEQERVFRIIANHSTLGHMADPLWMYIGGMAGTGKLRVIKSLIKFFEAKGKSFAFFILAPTGWAASLVGDSTYQLQEWKQHG